MKERLLFAAILVDSLVRAFPKMATNWSLGHSTLCLTDVIKPTNLNFWIFIDSVPVIFGAV